MIDAWRANGMIRETPQGLFVWTHLYAPHVFRPLKDNELWEWFEQ